MVGLPSSSSVVNVVDSLSLRSSKERRMPATLTAGMSVCVVMCSLMTSRPMPCPSGMLEAKTSWTAVASWDTPMLPAFSAMNCVTIRASGSRL